MRFSKHLETLFLLNQMVEWTKEKNHIRVRIGDRKRASIANRKAGDFGIAFRRVLLSLFHQISGGLNEMHLVTQLC